MKCYLIGEHPKTVYGPLDETQAQEMKAQRENDRDFQGMKWRIAAKAPQHEPQPAAKVLITVCDGVAEVFAVSGGEVDVKIFDFDSFWMASEEEQMTMALDDEWAALAPDIPDKASFLGTKKQVGLK